MTDAARSPVPLGPPIAYWRGQYVAPEQMVVPVNDPGFVMGTAISERMRTFDRRVFRLAEHLRRLHRSLEIVGLELEESDQQLQTIIETIVATNLSGERSVEEVGEKTGANPEVGICLFVTPQGLDGPPTACGNLCIYSYPLDLVSFDRLYRHGQRLVLSGIQQVPQQCWPSELKCRSRMHYYLADRQARALDPDARAILLDQDGFLSEASTANIVLYHRELGLSSPRLDKVLPGVSVQVLADLAARLKLPFEFRDLRPDDLLTANEVMLASTSPCVWPVTHVDNRPLPAADPSGRLPSPVCRRLLEAWSVEVGVDLLARI